MSTITTPINGQAVGSGANAGNSLYPFKVTKAAGSTTFSIQAKFVAGATGFIDSRNKIRIFFGSLADSLTASDVPDQLKSVDCLEVRLETGPSKTVFFTSDLLPFKGDYLYGWVDVPNLSVDGALTIKTIELP